jgi:pSer/pThr/pTyr-binding forkhead associated (FHA) protein
MRAQLIPVDGGRPVDIARDLTLVGRKEECDLRLDHKSVSKMHCVIVKTDGLLLVRDLGSTNGTRVNGQRVRRAALLPDDQLAIAGYKFRVFLGPDEPAPAAQDHTQQLNAEEVVNLLQKINSPGAHARPAPADSLPLQPNPLPDIYPDDAPASET